MIVTAAWAAWVVLTATRDRAALPNPVTLCKPIANGRKAMELPALALVELPAFAVVEGGDDDSDDDDEKGADDELGGVAAVGVDVAIPLTASSLEQGVRRGHRPYRFNFANRQLSIVAML